MVSAHFDLQPAIAACGAVATGSRVLLIQMTPPRMGSGCSLNEIANARKWKPQRANGAKSEAAR
jgi:hypothetical protein